MLEQELNYIKDEFIKAQTKLAIDNFPSYFERVMSSSTGKYHAVNETLCEHTRRDAKLGNSIKLDLWVSKDNATKPADWAFIDR